MGLNKKRAVRGWQSAGAMEGMFCREYGDGEVFGELALLEGHTLEGTVTSDDTEPVVALLSKANYDHVVANGFKGDLKRKLEYLKAPALVQRLLHHTDLKVLSYACSLETHSAKSVLYRQGAAAQVCAPPRPAPPTFRPGCYRRACRQYSPAAAHDKANT